MKPTVPITALVSAAAGLGLGYLLFHQQPVTVVQPSSADRGPERHDVQSTKAERQTEAVVRATESVPPELTRLAQPSTASQPVANGPIESIERLETQVKDLEQQLAIERTIRKGTEGEAIAPPPNLPARFRDEKLLLETFNAALAKAGFPGQVTNIDCTEHPCIVFGTGFGERGDLEKVKHLLGPYEHDDFSTYGFGTGKEGKEHRFFGVAVLPDGKGPPDEAVQKRVTYRVNQMHEASQPAPEKR